MTREEAISVLKETIDPNIDKSFKEWKEWDKEKHLPAVNMAIDALQAEPVKHGEWENTKYINVRKCSCCQAEYGVFSNKYWNSIEDFNFCPNCGAKMDKE